MENFQQKPVSTVRPDGTARSKQQLETLSYLNSGAHIEFFPRGVNKRRARGYGLMAIDRCFVVLANGKRQRIQDRMFNLLRDDGVIVKLEDHAIFSKWGLVDSAKQIDWYSMWKHFNK